MLRREGVEVVFGMPGGSIMTTYHPRQEYGIRHVLIRHEQAAAHAADGYARASGRVGVALTTSGPGATNLTTGIATAMMDSIPIVCITGQVRTSSIGSDAFQEADITGITLPITKHNYLVTDIHDLARTMREAFYVASTGRPGPVLIDLPLDVQTAEIDFEAPHGEVSLPGYCPDAPIDPTTIARIASALADAERPVVLAGHGVVLSGAAHLLRTIAEQAELPVATTLLGKGGFPDRHPLSLGMMGMHGTIAANYAIQEADLLLALGMRFDDRVTGCLDRYAPTARKIHVDIDPAEISKNVSVDLGVVADVRDVLEPLASLVAQDDRSSWIERIAAWKSDAAEREIVSHLQSDALTAPEALNEIWRQTEGDALVVTDVGQNQMWAAQCYASSRPRSFLSSGGLGTMGFALPAAMGAQIARPRDEVWVIAGDGGFQMNIQELATVVQEKLPLRIAVVNNGYLGMVRQWQEHFYDGRYEATKLLNPDFVRVAEAYGLHAWRGTTAAEACEVVAQAHACRTACLAEFRVVGEGEDGNVYPMVPAGAALHEMMQRPIPVGVRDRRWAS
jgi:acetolactate synthase-1/2/3 large subunit